MYIIILYTNSTNLSKNDDRKFTLWTLRENTDVRTEGLLERDAQSTDSNRLVSSLHLIGTSSSSLVLGADG